MNYLCTETIYQNTNVLSFIVVFVLNNIVYFMENTNVDHTIILFLIFLDINYYLISAILICY